MPPAGTHMALFGWLLGVVAKERSLRTKVRRGCLFRLEVPFAPACTSYHCATCLLNTKYNALPNPACAWAACSKHLPVDNNQVTRDCRIQYSGTASSTDMASESNPE
jgi:hypothetical protein